MADLANTYSVPDVLALHRLRPGVAAQVCDVYHLIRNNALWSNSATHYSISPFVTLPVVEACLGVPRHLLFDARSDNALFVKQ